MKIKIITFAVLLICFLIQIQTNFGQTSAPVDLGLLNGKAKTLAKSVYPETAKKAGVGGVVKINVTVDELGNVTKADAVSGEMLLRDASLTAARATKFDPYLVKGKAVKFSGFLTFNFITAKNNTIGNDAENKEFIRQLSEFLNNPNVNLYESLPKYEKGDYAGAIASATEEIKKEPTAQKYELRAKAYFQLKDYNNALKDINTAIEKTAGKGTSAQYVLRGDIYKTQYNYVLAENDYVTALGISPKDESISKRLNDLRQTKNSTEVETFQRELKQTLENFVKIKPVYEKKEADFEALLESEKKKSNVNVPALCESLSNLKSAWKWLDPLINKTTDKIGKLQQDGKIDEYFAGSDGTILLTQNSEMINWSGETYLPGKEKYTYLFDKLGCKALEKP